MDTATSSNITPLKTMWTLKSRKYHDNTRTLWDDYHTDQFGLEFKPIPTLTRAWVLRAIEIVEDRDHERLEIHFDNNPKYLVLLNFVHCRWEDRIDPCPDYDIHVFCKDIDSYDESKTVTYEDFMEDLETV